MSDFRLYTFLPIAGVAVRDTGNMCADVSYAVSAYRTDAGMRVFTSTATHELNQADVVASA